MSDWHAPQFPTPDFGGLADSIARTKNPAIGAFEQLTELIAEIQSRLDHDHELGAYLANVEVPFRLRNVKRRGALFTFEGVDRAGQDVLAIQHFGQLSLQLVKLRKLDDRAVRVGFLAD